MDIDISPEFKSIIQNTLYIIDYEQMELKFFLFMMSSDHEPLILRLKYQLVYPTIKIKSLKSKAIPTNSESSNLQSHEAYHPAVMYYYRGDKSDKQFLDMKFTIKVVENTAKSIDQTSIPKICHKVKEIDLENHLKVRNHLESISVANENKDQFNLIRRAEYEHSFATVVNQFEYWFYLDNHIYMILTKEK